MKHLNIEIKAKFENHNFARKVLKNHNAEFKGTDNQIDTYYKTDSGRLKMREGNIENSLIYYERKNQSGPKKSDVLLFKTGPESTLKNILDIVLTKDIVVKKKREIYFIENVKFHLDELEDIGLFIEIEAINNSNYSTNEQLTEQCNYYMKCLEINKNDLITNSYSDILRE